MLALDGTDLGLEEDVGAVMNTDMDIAPVLRAKWRCMDRQMDGCSCTFPDESVIWILTSIQLDGVIVVVVCPYVAVVVLVYRYQV